MGWIKLHKSLIDWEWYDDHNATRLLIHLLLTVNYEDKMWKGILIKAGSRVCSFEGLANETGLTIKQIRNSVKKLEMGNEIVRERARKGQLVTLIKWEKLQNDKQKGASKGQVNGHLKGNKRATTKEYIEDKEERINYIGVQDFWNNNCTKLSKCQILSDSRKRSIKQLIENHSLDTVKNIFLKANNSDFLTGKNERQWKADFDWVINKNNFIKILEGKYNNSDNQRSAPILF